MVWLLCESNRNLGDVLEALAVVTEELQHAVLLGAVHGLAGGDDAELKVRGVVVGDGGGAAGLLGNPLL